MVRTPKRSMIAWTYASSISMLVRSFTIHVEYTNGVDNVYLASGQSREELERSGRVAQLPMLRSRIQNRPGAKDEVLVRSWCNTNRDTLAP